jgi:hypothetical protein
MAVGQQASAAPTGGPYIVSPAFDWIFFLGSPALAIACVLGARSFFPSATIEGSVLVFMALGHHVPTFLRAYGDPDEYRANRFKLIAIPLMILPLVGFLYLYDSRLLYMVFIWDQYHFVRQQYGLMRFYDARIGVIAKRTYNLDQLMCFAWFGFILTRSDLYNFVYTSAFYDLGVVFPSWIGPALSHGTLAAAIVVSVAYVGSLASRVARGEPVSWLKVVAFLGCYAAWYYAYVVLGDWQLSYPIASFFHCLQYDALAWTYNRKKAAALTETGGARFFRLVHSTRMVWLYILCIFAYGFLSRNVGASVPGLIFVVNRTTGILHYYFDSFIWRMRKPEFRKHI